MITYERVGDVVFVKAERVYNHHGTEHYLSTNIVVDTSRFDETTFTERIKYIERTGFATFVELAIIANDNDRVCGCVTQYLDPPAVRCKACDTTMPAGSVICNACRDKVVAYIEKATRLLESDNQARNR